MKILTWDSPRVRRILPPNQDQPADPSQRLVLEVDSVVLDPSGHAQGAACIVRRLDGGDLECLRLRQPDRDRRQDRDPAGGGQYQLPDHAEAAAGAIRRDLRNA